MGRPVIDRWDSLFSSLFDWKQRGVKFRLSPDTQEMQYRDTQNALQEWEREHLSYCKREFTEALRKQAGLCILCGLEAAKRPDMLNGRRRDINGKWIPMETPAALIKPVLFCDACWDTGGLEQWAGLTTGRMARGGRSAKSDNAGRRDRAEEIEFPDDDGEAAPSPETGADLFAGF